MRALDFIHEIFQGLSVTAPLPKAGEPPGRLFAAATRRAFDRALGPHRFPALLSLCLHASAAATWSGPAWRASMAGRSRPNHRRPMRHASWRRIWLGNPSTRDGVPSKSRRRTTRPPPFVTRRWVRPSFPGIDPKTARMAQFLDRQINLLARNAQQTTDALYDRIQTEYQSDTSPPGGLPQAPDKSPRPRWRPLRNCGACKLQGEILGIFCPMRLSIAGNK